MPRFLAALAFAFFTLISIEPVEAQTEGPARLLRGLIDGHSAEDAAQIERRARSTRNAAEAESLYTLLYQWGRGSSESGHAALWLGRRLYGRGRELDALPFFEDAATHEGDEDLVCEALFWCDQTRRVLGHELSDRETPESGDRKWIVLRDLVRVDRAIHQGWRDEAESRLLELEGGIREEGAQGLEAARWLDLLSVSELGRLEIEDLHPLLRRTRSLSEQVDQRIHFEPTEPLQSFWTLQFGTFLDRDHARRMVGDLSRAGLETRIDEELELGRTWVRVRVGETGSRAAIDSLASAVVRDVELPFQIVRAR